MSKPFQVKLAPDKRWQAINPWSFYQQGAQFGLVNIELGQTPRRHRAGDPREGRQLRPPDRPNRRRARGAMKLVVAGQRARCAGDPAWPAAAGSSRPSNEAATATTRPWRAGNISVRGRSRAFKSWSRSTLHEGDAPLDPGGRDRRGAGRRSASSPTAPRRCRPRSSPSLPGLKVVMRSAIDIRNVDVAAASKAGVLVTQASAGFIIR